MNEQLQVALAKIMEQVASGAFNAADKLPEAFTQYVAYSRTATILQMSIFIVLAVLMLVGIFVSKRYASGGFMDDSWMCRVILFIAFVVFAILAVLCYREYILTLYPQAMALDMIKDLVQPGK